jgi:hypothetical protein
MLELLREKGYTEKQIREFYRIRERKAKMNVRYTIKNWENGE